MGTPEKNIYWKEINDTMKVVETPTMFVVTLADGSQAVAYWEGRESYAAQKWLRRRAIKTQPTR